MARQRADAERRLIGCIASAPSKFIPLVEALGISRDNFDDDLRVMFIALDLLKDRPRAQQIRVIGAQLRKDGFWGDTGPIDDGPPWNDASIGLLLGSHFPSKVETTFWARKLLGIDRRQREAREHMSHALALLTGEAA